MMIPTYAITFGACFAAVTFDKNSSITIGTALVIIGFVWKAGQQYKGLTNSIESHGTRLGAVETALTALTVERKTDMGLLRASIASRATLRTVKNNEPRRSVLLVDDDEADREIFTRMLSGVFNVAAVGTIQEASDLLSAQPMDCVLLDLQLPNGIPSQTVSRFMEANPGALCLVVTGNQNPTVHSKALAAGADMVILKDGATAEYVIPVIRDAIMKKKLSAEAA